MSLFSSADTETPRPCPVNNQLMEIHFDVTVSINHSGSKGESRESSGLKSLKTQKSRSHQACKLQVYEVLLVDAGAAALIVDCCLSRC